MNITFADRKLEKLGNDYSLALRKMGALRAKLFHQRLGDMYDAVSFADLQFLPGNYHSLTGNREGQWACSLDQPYRLIFEPTVFPIPTDAHGVPLLSEMKIVEIIEIIDYH